MKSFCRPGGFEVTQRALDICAFPKGARLLDCGCGEGATLEYLRSLGYEAAGVDIAGGEGIVKADAAALPFEAESFDGVFFECSLSKMAEPDSALAEARRVLKSKGRIAVSDFYAKGEETVFSGELLGRVEKEEKLLSRIKKAGFELIAAEDHSRRGDELYASLIFKHGAEKFFDMIGAGAEELKRARCGYGLYVGIKR